MIVKYFIFSFSIAVISWIIGMGITLLVWRKGNHQQRLSNLNFIKSEKVNRLIGLNFYKWIIIHSFFKYFNPKLSIPKKIMKSELREYRSEMTKSELDHLSAFLFVGIVILIKIFYGFYLFASVMLLVNIILNLYPSLLQQYNRRRIDRYLHVLEQRTRMAH